MTVLDKIGYFLRDRSEVPNQALAKELAEQEDQDGIREIATYLFDENQSIASDCIKVMYEIGYLKPALITNYVQDFIQLLNSKANRMVWGAMIAISTIAPLIPDQIFPYLAVIRHHIQTGTVITNVSAVRTLIGIASAGDQYYAELIEEILQLQQGCRKTDFAKRAEEIAEIIHKKDQPQFRVIVEERLPSLSNNAQKRVERVLREMDN